MKIISERKGFQADHSSTSYEFLAIDRKLNKADKADVSKLSSRAYPNSKQVSFVYNGDYSDLPGGWMPLIEKYYDVMYSESYGWWTLAFAFNTDEITMDEIEKYEFSNYDDLGVSVRRSSSRVIIGVYCRLDAASLLHDSYSDRHDYYNDCFDDDDKDPVLKLLVKNRRFLKNGNYGLLYGVWEKYVDHDDDESAPPETDMTKLPKAIKELTDMMENY